MDYEKNEVERDNISGDEPAYEQEIIEEAFENDIDDSEIDPMGEIVASKPKINWGKELREWFFAILFAVVITVGIKHYIFDIVRVEGTSMLPTVTENDRIILTKMGYKPDIGDIIVLNTPQDPNRPYIKRVIALAGQTVDIRNGNVYVDGEEIEEPYLTAGVLTSSNNFLSYPFVVPEDNVFVLGDNRSVSKDSRSIGCIPVSDVLGKANIRIWPLNSFGVLE